MTRKITYICDGCGKEIVKGRFYHRDYCLVLSQTFRPDVNRVENGIDIIDGVKHFCNKNCLKSWIL